MDTGFLIHSFTHTMKNDRNNLAGHISYKKFAKNFYMATSQFSYTLKMASETAVE